MPHRSLRWRGFGLTVEIPERVARALRPGRAAADDAQQISPDLRLLSTPPPVAPEPRDPEAGAAWIREDLPVKDDEAPIDPASFPWYHTLELPGGVVTEGLYDHRDLVPHYGLPDDLTGMTALDVGSHNGFWAFELERRGAKVTALDIASADQLDLPLPVRAIVERDGLEIPIRRGIEYARRELGSSIELVTRSVYDIDPADLGTFDLVHAGDILLHLRDPALALQRMRSVCSGQLHLSDVFDPHLDELGAGPGLTRFRGGWQVATWWLPSLSTLNQMVADTGYRSVDLHAVYMLVGRGEASGPWRAIIRAHV